MILCSRENEFELITLMSEFWASLAINYFFQKYIYTKLKFSFNNLTVRSSLNSKYYHPSMVNQIFHT